MAQKGGLQRSRWNRHARLPAAPLRGQPPPPGSLTSESHSATVGCRLPIAFDSEPLPRRPGSADIGGSADGAKRPLWRGGRDGLPAQRGIGGSKRGPPKLSLPVCVCVRGCWVQGVRDGQGKGETGTSSKRSSCLTPGACRGLVRALRCTTRGQGGGASGIPDLGPLGIAWRAVEGRLRSRAGGMAQLAVDDARRCRILSQCSFSPPLPRARAREAVGDAAAAVWTAACVSFCKTKTRSPPARSVCPLYRCFCPRDLVGRLDGEIGSWEFGNEGSRICAVHCRPSRPWQPIILHEFCASHMRTTGPVWGNWGLLGVLGLGLGLPWASAGLPGQRSRWCCFT